MKVSLNTIRQYIDFELPPVDELVRRINEQLGGVEEVIDLGAKYASAVVVRVVECDKHPNAGKLNVTKIDDGGAVQNVPRDENGLVQVVCGAPNVHAGMMAVWLPPASTVPATYDDAEPFVLGARELRGVMSHGMLASARELGLGDDHDGIVEITEKDIMPQKLSSRGLTLPEAGASFAEAFGLDDTIIDIENKMFTHRPDLFGQLGVAREISAILLGPSDKAPKDDDTRYVNPEWYWHGAEFAAGDGSLELEVFNDVPEIAPRFMVVALDGVTVGSSPLWLRAELVRWGGKPINNIVDVTNYIMLLTAQPTHAYDYDKLRGHKLGVRMAHNDEKILLLNGKEYSLTPDDIVIADGEGAVGLAGVMGGGNSEVSPETTRIVLEVANFDMYAVRRSSMRHGVFTDALARFNKGQSPLQNAVVLKQLMELMQGVAGGRQASSVYNLPSHAGQSQPDSVHGEVPVSIDFINERLGVQLTENQIGSMLRRVNMANYPAEDDSNTLLVTAPFWRTDIELPEDIVEEVGRLYGYDKLPRELPRRSAKPAPRLAEVTAKRALRHALSRLGGNEVLTYSFEHERVLKAAGQDVQKAFKIANALSPDLQYYRLSLLPSLLDKTYANIRAGHDEFMLFEVGKAHHKDEMGEDGLPKEFGRVAGVLTAKKPRAKAGSPYYAAQQVVRQALADMGFVTDIRFEPIDSFDTSNYPTFEQLLRPFAAERSALVWSGKKLCGVVGEMTPGTQRAFKLPSYTAGFELFISPFTSAPTRHYTPLSRYPSTTRDISLEVDAGQNYAAVLAALQRHIAAQKAADIDTTITPLTIYQVDDAEQKTLTFRVKFTPTDKTLQGDDVTRAMDAAGQKAADEIGAKVI